MLAGARPTFTFTLTPTLTLSRGATYHFQLSVVITAFTLFALGTIKSTFGAGEWWQPNPNPTPNH